MCASAVTDYKCSKRVKIALSVFKNNKMIKIRNKSLILYYQREKRTSFLFFFTISQQIGGGGERVNLWNLGFKPQPACSAALKTSCRGLIHMI